MPATLTRTTLGRQAAYSSTPITGVSEAFDLADWTESAPGARTLVSGDLRYTNAGSDLDVNIIEIASENISDNALIQNKVSAMSGGTLGAGVFLRGLNVYPTHTALLIRGTSLSDGNTFGLVERTAGTNTQLNLTAQTRWTLPAVQSLTVINDTAYGYDHQKAVEWTLPNITLTGGYAGLYTGGGSAGSYRQFSEYYRMSSAFVTVNGPTSGWKAQILDNTDSVLAEATASSGVASINVFAARIVFPNAYKIRIVDESDTLLVELEPTERVWGGDVYTYSAPIPDTPTGGPFVSYTFVMPSGSMNTDWLNARGAEGYQLQKVVPISPITVGGAGQLMCYFLSGSKF